MIRPMSLAITLSEEMEAALNAQARAVHMPTEDYLARLIESALQRRQSQSSANLQQAIDQMATHITPGTTAEEMEAALDAALAEIRPRRHA
jgi:hypothetical protein